MGSAHWPWHYPLQGSALADSVDLHLIPSMIRCASTATRASLRRNYPCAGPIEFCVDADDS